MLLRILSHPKQAAGFLAMYTLGRPFQALGWTAGVSALLGGTILGGAGYYLGSHNSKDAEKTAEIQTPPTQIKTNVSLADWYLEAVRSGEIQFTPQTLHDTFKDSVFPIKVLENGQNINIPGIQSLGIYVTKKLQREILLKTR